MPQRQSEKSKLLANDHSINVSESPSGGGEAPAARSTKGLWNKVRHSAHVHDVKKSETVLEGAKQRLQEVEHKLLHELDEDAKELVQFGSVLSTYAGLIVVGFLLLSATFFWLIEGTGETGTLWYDGLYWVVVTMTTVGYGDYVATTTGGKIFSIFFIFLALSLIGTCLGHMVANVESKVAPEDEHEIKDLKRDLDAHARKLRNQHIGEVCNAVCILVVFTGIGTLFLHYHEGQDWITSVYWSVVTCSSVGYGDVTIEKESSRVFLIFFIIVGVGSYAWALGKFATIFMELEQEKQVRQFLLTGVTETMITEMDNDEAGGEGHGGIDKVEFLEYMLVKLGKCTKRDVRLVLSMFESLDTDHSGTIDAQDIRDQLIEKHVQEGKHTGVQKASEALRRLSSNLGVQPTEEQLAMELQMPQAMREI